MAEERISNLERLQKLFPLAPNAVQKKETAFILAFQRQMTRTLPSGAMMAALGEIKLDMEIPADIHFMVPFFGVEVAERAFEKYQKDGNLPKAIVSGGMEHILFLKDSLKTLWNTKERFVTEFPEQDPLFGDAEKTDFAFVAKNLKDINVARVMTPLVDGPAYVRPFGELKTNDISDDELLYFLRSLRMSKTLGPEEPADLLTDFKAAMKAGTGYKFRTEPFRTEREMQKYEQFLRKAYGLQEENFNDFRISALTYLVDMRKAVQNLEDGLYRYQDFSSRVELAKIKIDNMFKSLTTLLDKNIDNPWIASDFAKRILFPNWRREASALKETAAELVNYNKRPVSFKSDFFGISDLAARALRKAANFLIGEPQWTDLETNLPFTGSGETPESLAVSLQQLDSALQNDAKDLKTIEDEMIGVQRLKEIETRENAIETSKKELERKEKELAEKEKAVEKRLKEQEMAERKKSEKRAKKAKEAQKKEEQKKKEAEEEQAKLQEVNERAKKFTEDLEKERKYIEKEKIRIEKEEEEEMTKRERNVLRTLVSMSSVVKKIASAMNKDKATRERLVSTIRESKLFTSESFQKKLNAYAELAQLAVQSDERVDNFSWSASFAESMGDALWATSIQLGTFVVAKEAYASGTSFASWWFYKIYYTCTWWFQTLDPPANFGYILRTTLVDLLQHVYLLMENGKEWDSGSKVLSFLVAWRLGEYVVGNGYGLSNLGKPFADFVDWIRRLKNMELETMRTYEFAISFMTVLVHLGLWVRRFVIDKKFVSLEKDFKKWFQTMGNASIADAFNAGEQKVLELLPAANIFSDTSTYFWT